MFEVLSVNLRVDLDDGPVGQHAFLSAIRKQVLHRLIWEGDFFAAIWKMFLWNEKLYLRSLHKEN